MANMSQNQKYLVKQADLQPIVIAGGGLTGLAMALSLARDGIPSVVVEREDTARFAEPPFDGRTCAIALRGQQWMAHIGVWHALAQDAGPIWHIHILDGSELRRARQDVLHFDHAAVGDAPMGYIIENRHMRLAFLEAARQSPFIRVIPQAEVRQVDAQPAHADVVLSTGETLVTPLVIVAEGRQSRFPERLNIPLRRVDYHQTAMVCTVNTERPHTGIAVEHFRTQGPFAMLPMQHPTQMSLVWTESTARASAYMSLSDALFDASVKERCGDWFGGVVRTGPRFAYPLSLQWAESFVAPRVALVGDAAHGIHPIAGQGYNLALRDMEVLSRLLHAQARVGLDLGDVHLLATYQQQRKGDTLEMMAVTDGLNRMFQVAFPPVAVARQLGLQAVQRLPWLKQQFIRNAMGKIPAVNTRA